MLRSVFVRLRLSTSSVVAVGPSLTLPTVRYKCLPNQTALYSFAAFCVGKQGRAKGNRGNSRIKSKRELLMLRKTVSFLRALHSRPPPDLLSRTSFRSFQRANRRSPVACLNLWHTCHYLRRVIGARNEKRSKSRPAARVLSASGPCKYSSSGRLSVRTRVPFL